MRRYQCILVKLIMHISYYTYFSILDKLIAKYTEVRCYGMYDYDLCLIGKRIKELRNSRDMVQEVLAERIGVSWSTISRLERGDSMVSIDKLLAIAEALGTGIDSILYDFISNDESSDDLTTRQLKYVLQLLNQKQKEYFLKNMQLFVSLFTEDTDK